MKELEEQKYWIWFSRIKQLGNKRKRQLLELYQDPKNIYELKKEELLQVKGIGEKKIEAILNPEIRSSLQDYMEQMEKQKISIISMKDKEYSKLLIEIYDPPISLYYKGNKKILNYEAIGMVGCREATEYGKKAAYYFSYQLAKEDKVIVSGLAKGIDSYSHIGCLAANGKTIAVLGNGLDTMYPKENRILAEEIIEKNGILLSEYPLGTKPEKMNFPARNRIISGISKGLLVIEAKEKSGTLITVDFALEQGREVFVVPGNINSINSVGTNELIKQGAKLVTNYRDIL